MKRTLIIITSIALLLLCWAALDDITTGTEPNFIGERIVGSLTIAWFIGLFAIRIKRSS